MSVSLPLLLVVSVVVLAGQPYDELLARWAVGYSACVYCEECLTENRDLACDACQLNANTVHNGTFYFAKDDIFAGVFVNAAQQLVVVAFRGTAPVGVRNYVADIDIRDEPPDYVVPSTGKSHKGFTDAFRGVRDSTPLLATVVDLARRFPAMRVLVTGHSLGAALATLCTVALVADPLAAPLKLGARLTFIGFGSPLVGDAVWADAVTQLFDANQVTFYRVVHYRDPVTAIPPTWAGFRHIANEVFYGNDMDNGMYEQCRSSHEGKCADALTLRVGFDDHLFYFGLLVGLKCGAVSGAMAGTLPPSATLVNTLCADGAFGAAGQCVSAAECATRGGEFHARIAGAGDRLACDSANTGCCVPQMKTVALAATTAQPSTAQQLAPGDTTPQLFVSPDEQVSAASRLRLFLSFA